MGRILGKRIEFIAGAKCPTLCLKQSDETSE